MNVSVIVSTYNRPDALRLCLASLAGQSLAPSEVLIADDGSGQETRDAVAGMKEAMRGAFPIVHVWQEDDGFRKARVLNETVRNATGEYLVFIDGDCMAHRHFLREHVDGSGAEAILSGKRVLVGKELTGRLLEKGRVLTRVTPTLLWDYLWRRSQKVGESFRISNPLIRQLLHRDRIGEYGILGCNFSIYRKLFYDINGFDEDFLDGSAGDTDLGVRVLNRGGEIRSVRAQAIVFHLWHPSTWSYGSEKYRYNFNLLRGRSENRETRCENGIVKPQRIPASPGWCSCRLGDGRPRRPYVASPSEDGYNNALPRGGVPKWP